MISIIWLFSFLSASPWALFTKVLQQYCVFFSSVPLISRQNKLLLCTIQSFLDSFHQGASTISTGKFISFHNLHFFLPSPIIFVKHNAALLLFIYCLSKLSFDISWQNEKQSFERNLRQREREQWEMYYGISHFNRKVNFLSYLAHFLPSPIIFAEHNSALLLLFAVCPNFPLTSFDKKKTKFKRNLRQERVSNEKMHNVIQNF